MMRRFFTLASAFVAALAFTACSGKGDNDAASARNNGLPAASALRSPRDTISGMPTFAYVNTDSLMANYNFCKDSSLELEKKYNAYQAQIQRKQQSFQSNYETAIQKAQNGGFTSESEMNAAQEALAQEQSELEALQTSLTQRFQQEEAAFNQALNDSLTNFLREYNEAFHYTFIFNGAIMLTADPAYDITADVVNGLNARYTRK